MKKPRKMFRPDEIATQISQAVCRDLHLDQQEYDEMYDPAILLRNRVVREVTKKFVSPTDKDPGRSVDATLKFLFVCEHMSEVNGRLTLPPLDIERPQSKDDKYARVLKRARLLMHSVLTPLSEDEWFLACKHGTGTSIGVPFNDTSVEAKSTLPITVTERAATYLNRYRSFDFQLKEAVESFNQSFPLGNWYRTVYGSRATTVPKTSTIDRMIAVEPTGNMFLQQGLMICLYDRMRSVGLELESLPDEHKERAKISSITSKEATIDFSNASDCVSRDLLRWLIPPSWFDCIDAVRSPFMEVNDEWINLPMFSTMGNAVTFPLETLVFWTLAHAVRLERKQTLSSYPEWVDLKKVSVFGDDCIVPTIDAHDFIEICEYVGFIVNKEKSFFGDEGFRESCGGDYLHGYDVRPYHLKGPSSAKLSALEPWLYIIGNRLLPKLMVIFGTRNYIYAAKEFFSTWTSLFRKYNFNLKIVPEEFPDDAGFKIGNDLGRFLACYKVNVSPVSVNQHGTYSFLFCRFQYWDRKDKFGDLRYWLWLKAAVNMTSKHAIQRFSRKEDPFTYRSRKRGGYVVARGKSAHWTLDAYKPSGL